MDKYLKLLYLFNLTQQTKTRMDYHKDFTFNDYKFNIAKMHEYPSYMFYMWKSWDKINGIPNHHIKTKDKESNHSCPICIFNFNNEIILSSERHKTKFEPEKFNIDKLHTHFQVSKKFMLTFFNQLYKDIWINI